MDSNVIYLVTYKDPGLEHDRIHRAAGYKFEPINTPVSQAHSLSFYDTEGNEIAWYDRASVASIIQVKAESR
jgi:hypothetical protein